MIRKSRWTGTPECAYRKIIFASKLTQKLGFIVTRNRVSNWETDKTPFPVEDRGNINGSSDRSV